MITTKQHRDTTIKVKDQPIDVTDDAGDVQAQADEILEHSTNVATDEDALVGQHTGIGHLYGTSPEERHGASRD